MGSDPNLYDAAGRLSQHKWGQIPIISALSLEELKDNPNAGKSMAQTQAHAQLMRGLIRAETQRKEVFAGQQLPIPVIDRPDWMENLAHAIQANAAGQHDRADELRQAALDAAPQASGTCQIQATHRPAQDGRTAQADTTIHYEWISDTDTRLGPVCEFITAGSYRWLAFADIASLSIAAPSKMLDLVWLPVSLTLQGTQAANKTVHGYIPTRYCNTENHSADIGASQRDALLLSHLTRWQDIGQTGVFATGQKTLMSDQGDLPLLDIRQLNLAHAAHTAPSLPTSSQAAP